ncbi:MAG: peptidase M3, partial [Gammaproteobacteria bacterium]|nr:peptidase M3 [Gammaproteobacteria bacterium]
MIPSSHKRPLSLALVMLAGAALPVAFASEGAPAAAVSPGASPGAVELHAWEAGDDPGSLDAWVHRHMRQADQQVARLVAVKGARTIANTLRAYDEANNELFLAQAQAQVLYGVGATKALRDKAQALTQEASDAATALSLNQAVYHALAAIPHPADAATRYYLEHTLLEYRLAGVDRDAATRARIKTLQDRITELGLTFERTVHDDVRTVVAGKGELDGLPPDYLASHPADADGHVKITTDPPDAWPAEKFATSFELRHELFLASDSVGYPANTETLRSLLTARMELARLLGYRTWADYAMADQMIGSPTNLTQYLEKIDAASRQPAAREDAALLEFARGRDHSIQTISFADARYWQEQYRRAKFNFDSQSVRPYFPYAEVERGVIDTASKLFHLDIRPVTGVRTWHPSVTTYDVYQGGAKLGRIYLDMHPREGKDKWFSTQPLTPGIRGRQLPEGVLVCN